MSARISCAFLALAALLASCSSSVEIPSGAQLTCGQGSDCPSGFVCHVGRCVTAANLDTTPPDLASAPAVSPAAGRAGTTFTIDLAASEPLLEPPEVTLALVPPAAAPCEASGSGYRCSYTATGSENGGLGGVIAFDVRLRDRARNETLRKLAGAVNMDFTAPGVAVANVVYLPGPSNPLPEVSGATVGTVVRVTVAADELLAAAPPPTLVAALGASTLSFTLVPGSQTGTGATFDATVPAGLPDGTYLPEVGWADPAGNSATVAFASPPIRLVSSIPVLSVDQAAVTYLRSPWGNAADEDLGGFVVPAGPYFALAPADPLSPAATLPAATFTADAPIAALRIWGDRDRRSLLATVRPNADGSWPRARLENRDAPAVWATALDGAGNESAPIAIESVEWVATASPPPFGGSPHAVDASFYLDEALVPDGAEALAVPSGALDGLDAGTALARARVAIREVPVSSSRPAPRISTAMAYDSARGRVVLYGGYDSSRTFGDTWEFDGTAWRDRSPAGPTPGARSGTAMAYDAARGRVVLFGGNTIGKVLADTWEWDGSVWRDVTPSGAGPIARFRHAMAFDARRRRVVLFGGAEPYGSDVPATTWEWDGAAWTASPAAGPSSRGNHAMAYDAGRSRIVLFGGAPLPNPTAAAPLDDLWEYDGVAWTEATQSGSVPGALKSLALVHDPRLGQVLLFGGTGPVAKNGRLLAWNGTSWTDLTPASGSPSPRSGIAAAWDVVAGAMAVFGGTSGAPQDAVDETWTWDGSAWVDRTLPIPGTASAAPGLREASAMAFDAARGRTVLFGGQDLNGAAVYYDDVWEWDGVRWRKVVPAGAGPAARSRHAMAFDPAAQRVVAFGGRGAGGYLGDLWQWDGAAWSSPATSGGPPSARILAGLTYDAGRGALVLAGGLGVAGVDGDTWELAGTAWSRGPDLPPRYGHSLLHDGTRTLSFFGRSSTAALAEVWSLEGSQWSNVTPATMPAARFLQLMAWDGWRGRALAYSGVPGMGGALSDHWEWNGSGFSLVDRPPNALWPNAGDVQLGTTMAFDALRGRAVLFDRSGSTWEWDADLVPPDPADSAARQRRTPMVQLTASYAGAGFTEANATALRVRARAGGSFGTSGSGASLLGWRTGGPGAPPGAWVTLASNGDGVPLAPAPSGAIDWSAAVEDLPTFFVARDARIAFQLRPAGASAVREPESSVEADYAEIRVRYTVPP